MEFCKLLQLENNSIGYARTQTRDINLTYSRIFPSDGGALNKKERARITLRVDKNERHFHGITFCSFVKREFYEKVALLIN